MRAPAACAPHSAPPRRAGSLERARTVLDGVMEHHPKRLDLWSVYLDMETRKGARAPARRPRLARRASPAASRARARLERDGGTPHARAALIAELVNPADARLSLPASPTPSRRPSAQARAHSRRTCGGSLSA